MADAAYEWCQGQYSTDDTRADGTWTQLLSRDLAVAYADWVNDMDLRDADDAQLTLDETEAGIYAMGSYAQALLTEVDEAATHFVQNTAFPLHLHAAAPGGPSLPRGSQPGGHSPRWTPSRRAPRTARRRRTAPASSPRARRGLPTRSRAWRRSSPRSTSPRRATLPRSNEGAWWINYNHRSASVSVSSLRDFVMRLRPARLAASPFDRPDRSSRTNQLFGVGEESTLHFSACVASAVEAGTEKFFDLR